jgi:hypothetical protein
MATSTVCSAASFDVETAVADFLADSTRTSLELPHMTTGQRKHAKQLVEQHAGLTCESYGFGQERKLHIIKSQVRKGRSADCEAKVSTLNRVLDTVSVKVKNTFIDDVVAAEGDETSESIIFRSMPAKLPGGMLQHSVTEMLLPALRPTCQGLAPPVEEVSMPLNTSVSTSASASSTASSRASTTTSSPATTSRDVPDVKNTFIHIGAASEDHRVVQTMPRDMFKQSAQQEEGQGPTMLSVSAASTMPIVPALEVEDSLLVGAEVVVEGLVKLPSFNGQRGVVQSFDKENGRYTVLLASKQLAKIKRANFRLLVPPPPPFHAPKLWLDEQFACPDVEVPSTPLWADDFSSQMGAGSARMALTLPLTALV